MEDIALIFKTYQTAILVMVGLSVGWALIVRFRPKWLGFDGKASWKAYLGCLLPIFVIFYSTYQGNDTSIDSPLAFDMHGDQLFIHGTHRYQREDENNLTQWFERDVILIANKQGGELARFNAGTGKIHTNKIFIDGMAFYSIADLKTGKILETLAVEDIKQRAAKFSSEKIFSFEYGGGSSFHVKTVRDNNFTYDALLHAINTSEGYTLFEHKGRRPSPYAGQTNLFKPEVINETQDGTVILLSYDDLEKKSFIISAIRKDGTLIWSKHDDTISPNLAGEKFIDDNCEENTLVDEQNLYFVNQRHLVCLSLSTGELKWMIDF